MAHFKSRFLTHNWIYNADYYSNVVEGPAVMSAEEISRTIVAKISPKSVIDIGCGTGALLMAFQNLGVLSFGLEYSVEALKFCRSRGVDVQKFDIEHDFFDFEKRFDVAISLEVAEHIPEKYANRYIDLMTKFSDIIIISAATPGQGGDDHVNEQPHSYWQEKFESLGFRLDQSLTEELATEWGKSGTVTSWYYRNLMIFRKFG